MSDMFSIQNISETEKSLMAISAECADRLRLAENLACTEETKQAAKRLRAELNKEFSEYEEERKAKTAEYEKPLKQFKELYDRYITKPFKNADTALKIKISEVEDVQRSEKAAVVEDYAAELITMYSLNWLDVSRIMPNIALSASEKSLKAAVKEKLDKIKADVDCINLIDESGEMFSEYMNCLDLGQAKTRVIERHKAIEAAEKAKAAYEKQAEIQKEAENKVDMLAPPTEEEETAPKEVTEKAIEKTYTMTFTVSGTKEQLKKLKSFMIENNIEFKNGGDNNG